MSAVVNEARPWEPFCSDGTPNWASYQAANARKLVLLAVDSLKSTGQALVPKAIRGYAGLFASVVYSSQASLGRKQTLQSALAGHLIEYLQDIVQDAPPPGLAEEEGDALVGWARLAHRRVVKLAQIGWDLMAAGTTTEMFLDEGAAAGDDPASGDGCL